MSGIEAVANPEVGYSVAVINQPLVYLAIGLIFTLVSLARSYVLRRAFEATPAALREVNPHSDFCGRP
jgi:hypothetical protein